MDDLKIARAGLADAEAVLRLQQRAYQSAAALYQNWNIPPLAQTLEDLRAEFARATFLKATVAGVLVGSVRARLRRGACEVGRFIVHPATSGAESAHG